jgi:uncharacterized membrane protein YjfL (UPF0719 family)
MLAAPPGAPVPELHATTVLATLIYSLLGIALFGGSLFLFAKLAPFSIRKEIEEDQNIAVAILIGSAFIGLAIIVAAAIVG